MRGQCGAGAARAPVANSRGFGTGDAMDWKVAIALWLVPIGAFLWARRRARSRLWQLTGLAFGAVISPAANGLYGLYFLGPFTALFGLIGLPLALVHGAPGYDIAVRLGLVRSRTPVVGLQSVYIEIINGISWMVVYGALGWTVDLIRGRRASVTRGLLNEPGLNSKD